MDGRNERCLQFIQPEHAKQQNGDLAVKQQLWLLVEIICLVYFSILDQDKCEYVLCLLVQVALYFKKITTFPLLVNFNSSNESEKNKD